MMRQPGFWLAFTTLLALGTVAPAADFVWMEGEQPSWSNYHGYDLTNWAGHAYLSEGKWLRVQVAAGDTAKLVPKEGILLAYDFVAPRAGSYEVWNRIGYEFVRSPFSWKWRGTSAAWPIWPQANIAWRSGLRVGSRRSTTKRRNSRYSTVPTRSV
jgi:hypothetical protein